MTYDDFFDQVMAYPPTGFEGDAMAVPARLLPGGGGVYLLTDEQHRVVQLASAANLRRALYNRLMARPGDEQAGQAPSGRRQLKLGEIVCKIRWRPTHSMFENALVCHRAARVLMPNDYLDHLAFGPARFVHVDAAAAIPKFVVSKVLRGPGGVNLGPFARNSDATRFVQILEDAFDLCRYYHILEQAPNGQACAYADMGRCPAPCDGTIAMSDYASMVSAALLFATGAREDVYASFREQMESAAAELAFERANRLKQRLERAHAIEHDAFRLVRPAEAFNYLVIQRGGGRTRVKPFFVCRGNVTPGPIARLKELDQVASHWIDEVRKEPASGKQAKPAGPTDAFDLQETSEQIWLVSHYLFKRDAPGMFIHASELGDPAALAEQVRSRFATQPKETTSEEQAASPTEAADQPEVNGRYPG